MNDELLGSLGTIIGLGYDYTPEQSAVINLSLEGVHLVLAGAGSGKTDTMSARALWLLATQGIRPDEILGLTFTRKAARQLAERFRIRIAALRANADPFVDAGLDLSHLTNDKHGLSVPTVSTYNSFASQIFTENAARIGWDADSPVITDATAYGIARGVVLASRDARLGSTDYTADQLTRAIIRLAAEIREFAVSNDDEIIDFARGIAELGKLPQRIQGDNDRTRTKLAHVGALEILLPMAREFVAEKKRLRVVEFADQIVFAREILDAFPEVAQSYRDRYKVVILDEYQDTAYSQTSLFSRLFGAERVTAVGDPNQSIYSWRGASPTNVASFHDDFDVPSANRSSSPLEMSWRNGLRILAAANVVLDNRAEQLPLDVQRLVPKPNATEFPISGTFAESTVVEAERLATWFLDRAEQQPEATMAMLIRSRRHLDYYLDEFDRRGVAYRLLGVAGILRNPFIADLYCALSVIAEPSRGARLIRLLGGARWQVSVDDLWSLHNHARNIAKEFSTSTHGRHLGSSLVADESDSLIDALDSLRGASRAEVERTDRHRVAFSDRGWDALTAAAEFFHELRRNVDLGVSDVVAMTAEALGLDIEARASHSNTADAHREAFDGLVHSYLAIPTDHSLRGFVNWVSEVEKRERTTPRTEEAEPGVVQVLTIHSSKGLEWDVVAVPRCTENALTKDEEKKAAKAGTEGVSARNELNTSANEAGWLQLGAIPKKFREDIRDSTSIPDFVPPRNATQIDAVTEVSERYTEALKRAITLPEERRLMYVAVTRAKDWLWISGSWFEGKGVKARAQSTYLRELLRATYTSTDGTTDELLAGFVLDEKPAANPVGDGDKVVWPALDPLGSADHRARYEAAAVLVDSASDDVHPDDLAAINHLLAVRDSATGRLPVRIPASRYAEWSTDLGMVREGARRPVPNRPYLAARIGTQVHSWIERGAFDDDDRMLDGLRDPDDTIVDDAHLAELKEKFLASRWNGVNAVAHEMEILLPRGNHLVVCKIDAVYFENGRWTVVDWKTGKAPETEAEKDSKAMQLVLYRRALAAIEGVPVGEVDAVLYYIAHDWIWDIERERLDRLDALAPID